MISLPTRGRGVCRWQKYKAMCQGLRCCKSSVTFYLSKEGSIVFAQNSVYFSLVLSTVLSKKSPQKTLTSWVRGRWSDASWRLDSCSAEFFRIFQWFWPKCQQKMSNGRIYARKELRCMRAHTDGFFSINTSKYSVRKIGLRGRVIYKLKSSCLWRNSIINFQGTLNSI